MVRRGVCVRGTRGYALLLALMMVVAVALASVAAVHRAQTEAQRERERQLRFVGEQYARAIASYYMAQPGARQYPQSIEDLLEDRRFPAPRHHLRRRYPDPMTGRADWVLTLEAGRIAGLHSRSAAPTLRQENGQPATYAQWEFFGMSYVTGESAARPAQAAQPAPPVQGWPGTTPPDATQPGADPPVAVDPAPAPPSDDEPVNCYAQYMAAVSACNALEGDEALRSGCRARAGRAMRDCRRAHPAS